MSDTEITLAPEDVAVSVYLAWSHASGITPSWDGLSCEAQAQWLRLGKRADQALQQCEGKRYPDVARELCTLARGEDVPPLSERERLCWEVVARHLMTLLDGEPEQLANLDGLERSWGPWAQQRREGR